MEIFYRIDAEIYRSEIHTFSDNPPNDYAFGGDSYDPQENKWESGVHRISKNQYEKRNQLDTQDINADAKLYFVEKTECILLALPIKILPENYLNGISKPDSNNLANFTNQ